MTGTKPVKRRRRAKTHDLGSFYIQLIWAPYTWLRVPWVRGWTQEIEEPFRTSTPLLVRLPFRRALVLGKWRNENLSEDEALNRAMERRDVTYDDFTEEAGWTPPPGEGNAEGVEDGDFGPHWVGIAESLHS